jgi:hypothetical protein
MNIIFLVSHMLARPYQSLRNNNMETVSLALLSLLTSILAVVGNDLDVYEVIGMSFLTIVPIVIFGAIVGYSRIVAAKAIIHRVGSQIRLSISGRSRSMKRLGHKSNTTVAVPVDPNNAAAVVAAATAANAVDVAATMSISPPTAANTPSPSVTLPVNPMPPPNLSLSLTNSPPAPVSGPNRVRRTHSYSPPHYHHHNYHNNSPSSRGSDMIPSAPLPPQPQQLVLHHNYYAADYGGHQLRSPPPRHHRQNSAPL